MTLGKKMKSSVQQLADWFSKQCDGDWEHGSGFTIATLDNPGVSVDIALRGTSLEAVPFEEKKEAFESQTDWMICRRTDEGFEGRGAPGRLEDIIREFLSWAQKNENGA